MRTIVPLFGLLLTAPALGQDLTVHPDWLVQPTPGTPWQNGVGSPAVAYDRGTDTWTMYFETQFEPPNGECRDGRWGIGRATSSDGVSWAVDPELVLTPQPGTYFDCVVAHPDIIFDGAEYRLWFKAQQRNNACVGVTPPDWGCAAVTGVGAARSTDGVNFTVDALPSINLFSFGFPSVVSVDGVLRMLLAYSNASNGIYELWESVSVDDGVTWSIPQFVLGPGFAPWVEDEIYNPALACDATPTDDQGPIVLFAGGRDVETTVGGPPRITTAGMGRAWSADGTTFQWTTTEPLISWNLAPPPGGMPDRDWRHWEAVRVGDDYMFFFSQRDDGGKNRIGLAYTWPALPVRIPELLISDRVCGGGSDTGSADVVDDTDDAQSETDTEDTASGRLPGIGGGTNNTDEKDGCGCAQPGGGAGASLALAALLTGRRRRGSTRSASARRG